MDEKHVRIPDLRDKMNLLFVSHPTIRRHDQLAKALGVPYGGLRNYPPDCIPIRYFDPLCKLFGLPAEVMQTEDLHEFKNKLGLR
jgi:hypothetical protein